MNHKYIRIKTESGAAWAEELDGKALLLVNRQKVNELLRKISEYMN